MKNGHNLEIYVIPMLEKLGYKKEDIEYVHSSGSIREYPIPDYVIGKVAVEVGGLSRKNKDR